MILNNSFSIYHDLKIESSIERVYDAISNPEHLVNWWPLKCYGILKKKKIYNFYFGEEYDWYGKVEKAHKYKSFYIKMINSDQDWNSTSFGFDLEKQESEILVKFRHTSLAFLISLLINFFNLISVLIGEIIKYENDV